MSVNAWFRQLLRVARQPYETEYGSNHEPRVELHSANFAQFAVHKSGQGAKLLANALAGTAAATLVGLLFVAVTVGSGLATSQIVHGTRGFLTPTLVHLGSVLFQTLAVLAPWPSAWPIGIILGLGGLMGLAYQINVVVTRHKVGLVLPHWQDWLPYVGVPALGSASLIVGAVGLIAEKSFAPYAIAGAMVVSLLAGIYGAWDLTLWMIKNRDKT